MIVDIVDKYFTDDNNPIKNLRLEIDRWKSWGTPIGMGQLKGTGGGGQSASANRLRLCAGGGGRVGG